MQLYYIAAGDDENNGDWFVWATDMDQAITIWREESGFDVFDRIWALPLNPPPLPSAVDWDSMPVGYGAQN